jgi:hypothetical protein
MRLFVVVVLLGLSAPALAEAKPKPITGKLSKSGYSVIALGYDGKAVVSKQKSFRIVPKDTRVTLQLRDKKGRYAGPIVVGGTRKQLLVGVKAGAKLGTIKVLSGYAKTSKPLATKSVDLARTAQASKGIPLGNGRNFGLVRSKRKFGAVDSDADGVPDSVEGTPSGGDLDVDGVPDRLDIDMDGDLVLNNEEAPNRGTMAAAAQAQNPASFHVFSQLGVKLDRSLNANAAQVTDAQIDSLVQGTTTAPPFQPIGMFLVFSLPANDLELDCGGLSYCTTGGTGRIRPPGGFDPGPGFPACCDPDGDGFGTMTATQNGPGGPEWQLYPLAKASQIRSGDVFVTSRGDTAALNFVFNTTPALVSWSSAGGQSGAISYPVAPNSPGTDANPLTITPGSDGNLSMSLTMWRPQRQAIAGAGEPSGFVDLGHLLWTARLVSPQSVIDCPTGYSTTDPNLAANPDPQLGGFIDQAADAPADPAHTLSFTLNLSACLAAKGQSWTSGDIQLELTARSQTGGDNSSQEVMLRHG